ncbi:Hypothetical protein GbCGDNIH2_5005 [Granulibacter bethesdensis]|uniref:Uncharacterized protein n=2 Tax=Granulibacter bethesdensis TaxID=364410 RepID=A0A286M2U3_GRABC|nr:Hypothetical protein GbCGDNIH3_5005 [Granulibacter bethesdensis]AHJ64499.1 Hypothetical protein GbCGDNIH4_5005 [Granulibacter bethesdensis CGDNIH4]ASV62342.1 Hypothetical protein GbCGDNIH1_5005 [Granulibacter bethesdensis CGDNIH1]AHJ67116.1 Hypothetical protein GbCGDNIH2_5005 [Granulibacter bethesdensis]APH50801.1 Hypothetical protein GbCGDNIH5_5005 [Granulibacter bethesdensis]
MAGSVEGDGLMTCLRAFSLMVLLLGLGFGLTACGKRGAPSPPGPPDQITYPHTYPSR